MKKPSTRAVCRARAREVRDPALSTPLSPPDEKADPGSTASVKYGDMIAIPCDHRTSPDLLRKS